MLLVPDHASRHQGFKYLITTRLAETAGFVVSGLRGGGVPSVLSGFTPPSCAFCV